MPLSTVRPLVAAAMLGSLLAAPAFAQETTGSPPPRGGDAAPEAGSETSGTAGEAPANPHEMLDELHGGPAGSPTARRGNPRPGTSTSIPTAHPARVTPLEIRQGADAAEDNTGIDGKCDPVVGLVDCPERPEAPH